MKHITAFREILKDTVRDDMQPVDVLLRAVVLHTHSIALPTRTVLEDVSPQGTPPRTVLAPLTRSHIAQLLASLWPDGDERHNEAHWFKEYGRLTPFELFTDIPIELADRARAAREAIARHSLVAELIEE